VGATVAHISLLSNPEKKPYYSPNIHGGNMFRILIIILFLCLVTPIFAHAQIDVLQIALDSVGFTRADLGYRPKGYWSRFPLDIPYKLTSFDDLFAEPLKLYDYSKTMANAVNKYMDPAFLDSNSLSLYYLTYSLGVDRKLGGFRNYSPNLLQVTDSTHPLESAFLSLYELAEEEGLYPFNNDCTDWETCKWLISRLSTRYSKEIQLILAKLILNITDIIKWRNIAFRNCDKETMQKIFEIKEMPLTQADGAIYYPELDDIAACIDYSSLHYAALKAAAIVQETADSLLYYYNNPEVGFDASIMTPYGSIKFMDNKPNIPVTILELKPLRPLNNLLELEFGGDHRYKGIPAANTNLQNPVSILIDLGGNDKYVADSSFASHGAGILGISVLYDAAGNDTYVGKEYTQGAGLFGVGILYDAAGNDTYKAELSGQGCGYFGIGLCFDAAGDDNYYIYGAGQGFGGIGGGVGVLADYEGNDKYTGEPSPEVYDLSDYHSKYKINGNGVQGVGFGRRGDITDGHAWAGGLGAIIDLHGDDYYLSGNWSLGCAYWFSTGVAYDGTGNDIYESCYFTQGSGAHFCNGILIDEGGDDKHEMYETAGAGLGFGWDYTNAFLINIGGNDSYRANMISIGTAEIRSNAFLIDIGGDDTYRLKSGALGLGAVDYRDYYRKPAPLVTYYSDSKSIGCFIDIEGDDKYLSFTDSTETDQPTAKNNFIWYNPAKSDSTYGANNFGIGIDIKDGIIPEIERWK
jgi:hypothetical protein